MAEAVSVSTNNDDMVTKLINAKDIRTPCVKRAFRAVDRANYVLQRDKAYSNSAWRTDNLHVSSPCIYAHVLEGLLLQPGLSFLNIGSGTGYLSTMVGMILGNEGTNHGVELWSSVISYANVRLKVFKKTSAYNEHNFANPIFVEGNAFSVDFPRTKYDRIYCGAAIPPSYLDVLKGHFLNVGGIVVAPVEDELVQVYKENISRDTRITLLHVKFSPLIRGVTPVGEFTDSMQRLTLQPVQQFQELPDIGGINSDIRVEIAVSNDDPVIHRIEPFPLCSCCLVERVAAMFLPCAHMVTCPPCANRIMADDPPLCPVCRRRINQHHVAFMG